MGLYDMPEFLEEQVVVKLSSTSPDPEEYISS